MEVYSLIFNGKFNVYTLFIGNGITKKVNIFFE